VDIAGWLRNLGLDRYDQAFHENEIDAEILPTLTAEDLKDIGVTVVGHRRKLLNAIEALRSDPSESDKSAVTPPLLGQAERRQLTVLFCDLVASTALSQQLDPEDMRDVIRLYQDTCAGVIARFEGFVAKFMGDGVLAYFGYPHAHEDSAERAVRAGLALTQAVAALTEPGGTPLTARVGIATGVVVVGDLIGMGASEEQSVAGETPNLAARLQALAHPGTVVVAPSTMDLVAGIFETEDLGDCTLKGIADPIRPSRVTGERATESRFEARNTAAHTPFIGREEEIALLLRRWQLARDGEGQVVVLSSEPGFGKSRITQALCETLAGEPHLRLNYQCSPYHTNSALHPIIAQLEFAAGFTAEDVPEQKLQKLEALLAASTNDLETVVPLLAALLSLPTADRHPPLTLSPQEQKAQTRQALAGQLTGLAREQPVLVIFEDVHWVDPTTLELLDLVIQRCQSVRALMIITHRPEFFPAWSGHAHVTTYSLNRLGRKDCAAMVENLAAGKRLPRAVLEQIVAKTDGVPLFVEELTKTVLESGLLVDAGDRYVLEGPLPPMAIPTTLQDSLMARLDRLGRLKEIAQTAAVIGREFDRELVAEVAEWSDADIEIALTQLVEAGLIFPRGAPPSTGYIFKHALVQDAAYGSLLRGRRQSLHGRILEILERSPETVSFEILARHAAEAGDAEKAVDYWWHAAQAATARSAIKEAIAHLQNGLRMLATLPESEENTRLELDMQLALGNASIAVTGWASETTAAAFERARVLSKNRQDPLPRNMITNGRYVILLLRGRLNECLELADDLSAWAEEGTCPPVLSHRCRGVTLFHLGQLDKAREQFETGLLLYDEDRDHGLAHQYGYNPLFSLMGYLCMTLHHLGHLDQARDMHWRFVDRASTYPHIPSRAFGLFQASVLRALDPEISNDRSLLDETVTLCEQYGFPNWHAMAVAHRGMTIARSGALETGLQDIKRGLDEWRSTGATLMVPHFLLMTAEVQALGGEWAKAIDCIIDALDVVPSAGGYIDIPKLLRTRGQIAIASGEGTDEDAASWLTRAIVTAREQNAHLEELRAATSLARLWGDQGKRDEARDLLAPIHDWFTEGFNMQDLKEAGTLLHELR